MTMNESAENYLETILILSHSLPVVRSVDIANEMGFKKSSVSVAMKNLREGLGGGKKISEVEEDAPAKSETKAAAQEVEVEVLDKPEPGVKTAEATVEGKPAPSSKAAEVEEVK